MSRSSRRVMDWAMTLVCGMLVLVALVPLASLLWLVVSRGLPGLSFSFLTGRPAPVGEAGGGVGNGIVGTLMMVGMASAVAIPVGVAAGVFLAEKGDGTFGRVVRFTTEVLSGVPSIVVGIVAYTVVVIPMGHFSALAGSAALTLLMIPPLARATEEFVRLVPSTLREASLALGVPAWRTSLRVILPTAMGGIATASLIAVARAAGETAPLLFTALSNAWWNLSPVQPTASLTVQIFNYSISPYEEWHRQAWSGALVLLILVGLLNLAARLATRARFADPSR